MSLVAPHDPRRGLDLYLDSSGEEDWNIQKEKYYLHGLMCCGPSPEWLDWMNLHKSKYDGMVHWGSGEFGKLNQKLPNKKQNCRELLAAHPWLQTAVFIFDKDAFKGSLLRRGWKIARYEITKRLWYIVGVTYLKMIVPHIKKLVPDDPWGCTNIRNIVINNPKGADRSKIEKIVKEEFGRPPQFVTAGHYGIDALDGVLWAFNRSVNLGKADGLPDGIRDFGKELYVVVLGIRSAEPTLLRNLTDVENFLKNG